MRVFGLNVLTQVAPVIHKTVGTCFIIAQHNYLTGLIYMPPVKYDI